MPKQRIPSDKLRAGSKRYAVYIRVSTDMQAKEGDSVETQRDLAMKIIQENHGELAGIYEDPGVKAYRNDLENRPALMKLLGDIKAGTIDAVIVFKRDRLARNPAHAARLRQEFRKYKVEVIYSAPGEIAAQEDDPMGNYIEGQLALMAELESAIISQRVSAVMHNKACKGQWLGGQPPYGYIRVNGHNVQVPEEIAVVREIESLYLSGVGEYTIARWLNGDTIKGLGTRPGGAVRRRVVNRPGELCPWTVDAVHFVLTNPFYCGFIQWNKASNEKGRRYKDQKEWVLAKGDHEPCRTLERHQEIQAIRQQRMNGQKAARFYSSTYLLTGLLYCKECGCKWASRNRTAASGKQYFYYLCGSKTNKQTWKRCNSRMIQRDLLERFVIDRVYHYADSLDFSTLLQELDAERKQQVAGVEAAIAQLETEIADLEEQKVQNLRRYEEEEDPDLREALKARHKQLKADLEERILRRAQLQGFLAHSQTDYASVKRLYERLRAFPIEFQRAPYHFKKAFLDDILERIDIGADGTVDLVFKLKKPGSDMASGSVAVSGRDATLVCLNPDWGKTRSP